MESGDFLFIYTFNLVSLKCFSVILKRNAPDESLMMEANGLSSHPSLSWVLSLDMLSNNSGWSGSMGIPYSRSWKSATWVAPVLNPYETNKKRKLFWVVTYHTREYWKRRWFFSHWETVSSWNLVVNILIF